MSASTKPDGPVVTRPAARPRSARAQWNVWLRWLHTYTSMISLLVVLFFALTGVTLNHPDWVFGTKEVQREVTGTLPAGWIRNGEVNWLTVAEELRAQQGLKGRVGDTRADTQEADISFAAPGYSADAFIDVKTGSYKVNVLEQGGVAILNDLHKGRDAGTGWKWVIDLSGAVLTLVSVTGIGILLLLKKTRRQALTVMGIASVVTVLLALRAIT
ncbi:PepSY-associated TM helix domain-containing protein [Deinococcus fonticola]|uniref:PepSY-associated TM helix domain-containing protein n=1 Tax=Deinococcus fonticola TaxID=2528713 RepID=UPI001074CDCC|nr:PepSY-associated TM helix domain-containing protein [Deinococcus fonticola]